jgi:hypothetical protein
MIPIACGHTGQPQWLHARVRLALTGQGYRTCRDQRESETHAFGHAIGIQPRVQHQGIQIQLGHDRPPDKHEKDNGGYDIPAIAKDGKLSELFLWKILVKRKNHGKT